MKFRYWSSLLFINLTAAAICRGDLYYQVLMFFNDDCWLDLERSVRYFMNAALQRGEGTRVCGECWVEWQLTWFKTIPMFTCTDSQTLRHVPSNYEGISGCTLTKSWSDWGLSHWHFEPFQAAFLPSALLQTFCLSELPTLHRLLTLNTGLHPLDCPKTQLPGWRQFSICTFFIHK